MTTHNSAFLSLPLLFGGVLTLSFDSPVAVRYGVALWSDPAKVRWSGANALVSYAGRAAAVAAFDLPRGRSTVSLRCMGCTGTTFPIAP